MNNNFGKLLIDLREKNNYTQKSLAKKLNISDKAVSRWETGSSIPNIETLVRISKLFHINLQDLIIAAASTDENDKGKVEEIIKEFTRHEKQKSKLLQFILAITLVVILILTITMIFTKSYNRFKVYNVSIESDEIYPSLGVYVETRIKDSLYLGNIKIRNYELKQNDIVIIDLYYVENEQEYILQTYTNLDNIRFVNYDSYIKINDLSNCLDKLYIRIKIINDKNKELEYVGKLRFLLDFSNNKIFYKEEKPESSNKNAIPFSPEEIKNILLQNGFKNINEDLLKRKIENGSINYMFLSNTINIYLELDNLFYKYDYILNNSILKVRIFNKNNVEIENYTYDAANKKLIECITGSCKNYDKVMEFINKNVLYLLNS